jgi:protein TonB
MAEKEKPKSTRRVYGMSRKSLVQSDQSAPAPIVKKGNTLSTSPDDKTLNEDDPDSLPSPTDEYLVTAMPTLVEEYRIPYPLEAKAKSIQGAVVMELLIDSQGNVREAKLIEGPGGGLNEAALEAVRKFRFNPARIETQAVTVRIRYAYRFVLER